MVVWENPIVLICVSQAHLLLLMHFLLISTWGSTCQSPLRPSPDHSISSLMLQVVVEIRGCCTDMTQAQLFDMCCCHQGTK